jgi:uncharacterized cupin superfamily protein
MGIAHWDEVEQRKLAVGPMQLTRVDLGDAAKSRNVGVARLLVEPGGRSSPVHVELDEEEIFFVLGGSGLSWQDGKTFEIGPGDCIVHRAAEETHTLIAGADGLDVLAFGERTSTTATYLPRAGVLRMDVTVEAPEGPHAWEREAAAGDLTGEPAPRPANIVNLEAAESEYDGAARYLGSSGGAIRTGLNWVRLPAGERGAPPHCHSAEEEIFVVLDGEGILELWPAPGARRLDPAASFEEHPVRRGHVIARPPGTRIAHSLRAATSPLTYLAYGTREPNDMCYYPRSNKIFFRGLGLIARLESLEYSDGEPDD